MKKRNTIAAFILFAVLALAAIIAGSLRLSSRSQETHETGTTRTDISESVADNRPPPRENRWIVRNMEVETVGPWTLSRKETEGLVEVAMDEIGNFGYDRNAPIRVEEEARFFTVTFPEPPHDGPPELICCADFAMKVRFDKETRKVAELIRGG